MADNYTSPQNFVKPETGGSRNTWGTKINDNLDALDRKITAHDQSIARRLDISGTPAMAGSITFQNNGTGLVFSSGGKMFDTGAALVVHASEDTFRVFNEAGTLELLSVTPSTIRFAGSEVLTRANFNQNDFLSTSGGTVNGNVEITGSLTLQGTVVHSKAGSTYQRSFGQNCADSFDTASKIFNWTINGNQAMYVTASGDFTASGKVTQLSDARVKTNVLTLTDGLSTALKLRPVRYTRTDTGADEIGVIAQEVEAILPECVVTSPDGVKAVSYGNLVAVALSAIRDLNTKIEALEAQIGGGLRMLPMSGRIGLDDLQREFGGDYPTELAEYLAGGKYVKEGTKNGYGIEIPKVLPLSLSDFYGAERTDPGEFIQRTPGVYEFVVPYYNTLTITVAGGGGSSGGSAWDGPGAGDDPGYPGFGGDPSFVGGTVTYGQPRVSRDVIGRQSSRNDPHIASDFLIGAGGGEGGGGSASPTKGQSHGGEITALIGGKGDDDTITIGGGGKGGAPAPWLGYISTAMGGPGGDGGLIVVKIQRDQPLAPKPGDKLSYVVGRGGDGLGLGAINKGADGWVGFRYE